MALAWLATSAAQAQVEQTNLPAPASVQVDFARDIKPILDQSCLRCHGPERPRSRFRLDNRASALQGGDNGVDIIPGDSAKSPLIKYVARLDPDRSMPPEGKGEPLNTNQISLLRAWIDQGAAWGAEMPTNLFDLALSPRGGWTFVRGDKAKFREQNLKHDGLDAGLESFELFSQSDPDTRVTASGHALINDYKIVLDMKRNDLGFIRGGWEQYRRYYDDTGGYFPAPSTQPPLSLDTDLHVDIGKAWVDFGLALPHWPQMVLGYELDYRNGVEAITSWQASGPPRPVNIAPATKEIHEGTHVFKFDLTADVHGYTIEDRFRGEFYTLSTAYTNLASRDRVSQNVKDSNSYFQGANSIRVEKRFKKWLMASGGYFYSKLNADDMFTNNVILGIGGPAFPASVPEIALERESHVANLNALLGPFSGFSVIAGAQSEWTHQEGFGSGTLNGIAFTYIPALDLQTHPSVLSANYDETSVSENIGLRYTKIPFTSLFADARLRQQNIDQSDSVIQTGGQNFSENPSFRSRSSDVRAGFNTSPWQRVSFTVQYHRYEDDSHYDTNQVPQPIGGYPGFISWRDLVTDEVETKLVFRPFSWLKASLSYQYASTDFREDTRAAFLPQFPTTHLSDGGTLLSGRDDSNIYSILATFIPLQRLYFSGIFSYRESKLTTASAGAFPPYEGEIFSVVSSATYIMTKKTDLLVSYSCSLGDYSQEPGASNLSSSPPLGLHYQQYALQAGLSHHFSKNLTTRLQYGYYMYEEPPALGVNDYHAHMIFASLTYHMR